MHSLQLQLSLWLSGVMVSVALLAGTVSFFSAFEEANELQDDQLRQVATLINTPALSDSHHPGANAPQFSDPESRIAIQLFSARDTPILTFDGERLAPPVDLTPGMHTMTVGQEPWRIFVRMLPDGQRLAVGQVTEVRDEVARSSGLAATLPLLVLIPVLVGLVAVLVRLKLKPLRRLASDLDQRDDNDLAPLDDRSVPNEIRPFTASINRLLQRVGQSIEQQRCFIADAAHELRSPLTALSLQVESLQATGLAPDARTRLGALRQGVQRTRSLLEQLLTLARSQSNSRAAPQMQSVQAVFRRVLEDLIPLAERKQIDLGVVCEHDVQLRIDELDLYTLVRNLLDNAIRYTPPGGRVDLDIRPESNGVVLEVSDNGPGIPPAERTRVLDPFYRVLGHDQEGSGLGLSIVNAIVMRLGGSLMLMDANPEARPPGLRLSVKLPRE